MRLVVASFFTSLWFTSANAHDVWADGSPVPFEIKRMCCGEAEMHRFAPDQVHEIGAGGFRIDGFGIIWRQPEISPANDGYWYVFAGGLNAPYAVHCFFRPPLGS
jgi:hypothetical protein